MAPARYIGGDAGATSVGYVYVAGAAKGARRQWWAVVTVVEADKKSASVSPQFPPLQVQDDRSRLLQ